MTKQQKHPVRLTGRVLKLLVSPNSWDETVNRSYNRISNGYDQAWTDHMRHLTLDLIYRLDVKPCNHGLDLTCGTGFATQLLTEQTGAKIIGVDRSEGMLQEAKRQYGRNCQFVQADILQYLRLQDDCSMDVVTCCWGLGYSRPRAVLREIRRVLRPRGVVAIIDNSLFSLIEVVWCSVLAFMEFPEKLVNLMRVHFMTSHRNLWLWFKLAGLIPLEVWSGKKSYHVPSGAEAIARLRATGAAAGFEYACRPEDEQEVFARFGEILEQRHLHDGSITINHRYLAGIARR